MRIAKRLPLFLLTSVLTFAFGVWFTRVNTTATYCPRFSPWERLLKFENQDLQGLDEESRRQVQVTVEAITGKRNENTYFEFVPELFRLMLNTKGEKRYVLVELMTPKITPGNSSLRVHVFDTAERLLSVQDLSAGYRMSVTSMRVRDTYLAKHQLLIVDGQYEFGGPSTRQYYALSGDSVDLIYLEKNGFVDHNSYGSTGAMFGPDPGRSANAWANALASSDDTEVLSALVWFNGNHETTLSHDSVRKRLNELSQSENLWIKTAAESALEHNK